MQSLTANFRENRMDDLETTSTRVSLPILAYTCTQLMSVINNIISDLLTDLCAGLYWVSLNFTPSLLYIWNR